MKVVIASDSFKECLSALEVAEAIEAGIKTVFPEAECVKVPVADGGEGTLQSLVDATNGRKKYAAVTGPLGKPVNAAFGLLGDGKTAVIEMAEASGLALVSPDQRNPLHTTSYGTGELILQALDLGAEKLIIGIGGSATNDGGAGMLEALGVRFLNKDGQPVARGGDGLQQLAKIDVSGLDQRLLSTECVVACDVSNPLTGINGASHVFGPQKGATAEQVDLLDQALSHYGDCLYQQLGKDVTTIAGAGAAGGMGAALIAFFDAQLRSGIDIVMTAVRLQEQLQNADLVITGEGRIDGQTAFGKTPVGVSRLAKTVNLPVIAFCGCLGEGHEAVYAEGVDAVFPILSTLGDLDDVLASGTDNIRRTTVNAFQVMKIGSQLQC